MRRHAIGIVSVIFLTLGVGMWIGNPAGDFWIGASIRIGAVLLALWLAFPQVSRVPPWIYGSTLVLALVVAAKPKWIVWVLPTLIALWLLRPRGQTAKPRSASTQAREEKTDRTRTR